MNGAIRRKLFASVVIGAALVAGVAHGAGLFQGLPATTANTQTGNETIPVDTNLTQGLNPASEVFSLAQLNLLPYVYSAEPTTGVNFMGVVSPNVGTIIFDASAQISRLDLSLPVTPLDGYTLRLASTQNITVLTIGAPNGQTVKNAPTMLLSPVTGGSATVIQGPTSIVYLWRLANATWYRLQ